ncbi:MAG: hypothetical protein ACXV5L_08240 [Thermoanaerobaculia bacterium]
MNIDYRSLEDDLVSGVFRTRLETELEEGFRDIKSSGERLPVASHYAAQIAEIVSRGAPNPLLPELAFNVYQEILAAVEAARETVLGEV